MNSGLSINKVVIDCSILGLCEGKIYILNDNKKWTNHHSINNCVKCIDKNYVLCSNGDILDVGCDTFEKSTIKITNIMKHHDVPYWLSPIDNNLFEYDDDYMTNKQIAISMAAGLLFANIKYIRACVDLIDVDVLTYEPSIM